jgi:hypothetical protein
MGLVDNIELKHHNHCPVKYQDTIPYYNVNYTYNNLNKLCMPLNWGWLSDNTHASVIMANIDKPWILVRCGNNRTFTFDNFERLCKYRNKLTNLAYFHTITWDIYNKYKKYISWRRDDYSVLPVEAVLAYPDKYDVNQIWRCHNFQCTIQPFALTMYSSRDHRGILKLDNIWRFVDITAANVKALSQNPYIPLEIIQKYEHLTWCVGSLALISKHFDVVAYTISKMIRHPASDRKAYIGNPNLNWKFARMYPEYIKYIQWSGTA